MLFRLARRNLLRHPWRTLATVLGVALGVAVVLATLSVGDNVQANLASSLEAATGQADLLILPGASGRAVFSVDEALAQLATLDEATLAALSVTPVLNVRAEPLQDVVTRSGGVVPGVGSGFQLSGRDTANPAALRLELIQGELPRAGSGGVALTEEFADGRGLSLGEDLAFATQFDDTVFEITGFLGDEAGLGSTNSGRVGLVALADLQRAMRLEGRASLLEVSLGEGASLSEVREQLEIALGDAYALSLPAGTGDFAAGIVETLQSGLRVLAATLMALAGFTAYNTFAAAVVERTREYALLRTICLTRAQVQRLALLEAALLSGAGVALGLLLGVGVAYLITLANASLLGYEYRTLVLPVPTLLVASVVGSLVSLAAGYLPARAASLTPPLVAARTAQDVATRPRPLLGLSLAVLGTLSALSPWRGLWALGASAVSLALLFAGIVFLAPIFLRPTAALLRPLLARIFGVAGKLGADFSLRNAQRNGVAIGAVVVGLTLTIGVGGMVAGINRAIAEWVETTIVGDMFVTSPVSFPAEFEAEVTGRVPQIAELSGVGVRVVRFQPENGGRGRSVALVLVDPERFNPERGFGRFQFIAGQGDSESAYDTLKAGGQVLAANTLQERFGLTRGDAAELRTNEGFRAFPVGGVVVDFTGGGEAFVGSLEDMPLFGGGTPDLYVMNVAPGEDAEVARAALEDAFPNLYLDISLNRDYRERILSLTQQTFYTTNGLLALAVFIAALGVANTLGMNLSERQHDIAMLRTLGLTRGRVHAVISAEGVILLTLGTVLGIATGLLLSRVITSGANALTGFEVTPQFPWTLIALALVSSPLVGLVASFLPARRATRVAPALALGGAE